jgi:outer membrane receptor protein involved in Fe transport
MRVHRVVPSAAIVLAATAMAGPGTTFAQVPSDYVEIEVPAVVLDDPDSLAGAAEDESLELANLVLSATRDVTTVQEAPAIVTVVTADDIAERQLTSLEQIVDTVPGWMRLGGLHSNFSLPLTRGQPQAALFLHDGVSLFDPAINVPTANRVQPVETIKRVEFITGPGGVLWSANALLGIINVITKSARDVDGVEAGVTGGHGNGDREVIRAYVMAGAPGVWRSVDAFFHASVESFRGPGYEMPAHLLSSSLPQPNTLDFYGPLTRGEPARSTVINLSGKLGVGGLELRGQFPIVQRHTPLSFDGGVVRERLPEDDAVDPETGMPLCSDAPPYDDPTDPCSDRGRHARDNQVNLSDRYLVAEYRTSREDSAVGVSVKGYLVNFVRRIDPFFGGAALPGIIEGGISFGSPIEAFRSGVAVDGDAALPRRVHLLWGVEVFREWQAETDTGSRQGDGVQTDFDGPLDVSLLPLPCPRDVDATGDVFLLPRCPLTMTFPATRTVLSGYVDGRWQPTDRAILNAGARLQAAPASLGLESYDLTPTLAAALVYNLVPGWYLKLNVAQGFRPPIFNNTDSNGEAIQIDGKDDLEVETSTAGQVEVNARVFKSDRAIRELSVRFDYSYTYLQNLIQIVAGRYENTADRAIHSAEMLAKLHVRGGHRIELGYTWLRVETEDVGLHRSLPEHWFNLGAVLSMARTLSATATLRVIGALEDPNRMVDTRDYTYGPFGEVIRRDTGELAYAEVTPSELVLDRLPPVADLAVGVTWTPTSSLDIRATVQNAFNARYYQPDAFFSYEPRVEFLPNPAEDVRGYLSAVYRY